MDEIVQAGIVLVEGLVLSDFLLRDARSEVDAAGVGKDVAGPGIHGAAAWVHLAGQDTAQCQDALFAGEADPERGVDLVGKRILGGVEQKVRFHGRRDVEQDDDLLESGARDFLQHVDLVLVQLQVVGIFAHSPGAAALMAGQVGALAADTGDHHDRQVVVVLVAAADSVRIHRDGRFADGKGLVVAAVEVSVVVGTPVAGGLVVLIERFQRFIQRKIVAERRIQVLVGDIDAQTGQAVIESRSFFHDETARTAAAEGQVHAVLAEDADFGSFMDRQRVVFVLQENEAFLGYLDVDPGGVVIGFFLAVGGREIHHRDGIVVDRPCGAEDQIRKVPQQGIRQNVYDQHERQENTADDQPDLSAFAFDKVDKHCLVSFPKDQ